MRPYMTEGEAKVKWCPMVRHESDGATFNRGCLPGNPVNIHWNNQGCACNCIGSSCMWWGISDDLARVDRRGTTPLGRCEAPGGAA